MKKVLIITNYFPPRPSIASRRLGGLAKYLFDFGWEPIILTTHLPGPPDPKYRVIQTDYHGDILYHVKKMAGMRPDVSFDEQPEKPFLFGMSRASVFHRILEFIYGLMIIPDEYKGWYPFAVKEARKILKQERIDAIISSSHPVTAHVIGHRLKKESGLPWIADLRDLWTQHHYYRYGSHRKWIERNLEIKTLSNADELVTVSEPLAQQFRLLHKSPVSTITNGFDPQEISKGVPLTKTFTITYTGRVYDIHQDPSLLFAALKELIAEGKIDPSRVQVRFWGPPNFWLGKKIEEYKLEGIVQQHGMIPHQDIVRYQRESQVLLLLNWLQPGIEGIYTGKIFEYLAAKRPLFVVGHQAVVNQMLTQTGVGTELTDLASCRAMLLKFYQEYEKTGQVSYAGNDHEINKYSQYEMARKFAAVLEKITGRGK